MADRKIHIVPHEEGWAIKTEGSTKAYKVFGLKKEAEEEAYIMASRTGAELITHGLNGKILTRRWVSKVEDDESCFITTACVRYFQLPDNCYQLTTLRNFRDSYLVNTREGKSLVQKYYTIAPSIVNSLHHHKNNHRIYQNIFTNINLACALIEGRKFKEAKTLYIEIVKELQKTLTKSNGR